VVFHHLRGADRLEARNQLLREAQQWFDKTLQLDLENTTAHYNLGLIHNMLGDGNLASEHRRDFSGSESSAGVIDLALDSDPITYMITKIRIQKITQELQENNV
jgi:hypothetical protein